MYLSFQHLTKVTPYQHNAITSEICVEEIVQSHPQRYVSMLFPRGMSEFQIRVLFHAIIDNALVEGGRLWALHVTSKHVDLRKTAPKRLLNWAMQM